MQALVPFLPLGTSEEVIRTFDFSLALGTGETLTPNSATCEIEVFEGVDATPENRLIAPPTITGNLVTVLIGTMIDGVTYRILAGVTTSANQQPSLWTYQKCVGP